MQHTSTPCDIRLAGRHLMATVEELWTQPHVSGKHRGGTAPHARGQVIDLRARRRPARDRPARWLTASMLALAVLAIASAVVSYSAQYRMVFAAKRIPAVAALE